MSSRRIMSLAFSALMALAACGGDEENIDDPAKYYEGPDAIALGAPSNQASCATCHSDDGTQVGYSGNTFVDIAYRTSFKGGQAPDLLAASNACIVGWMGGEAITEEDEAYASLKAYMESLSSPDVTTPNDIVPEVLANEAAYEAAYAGGDAAAGEAKYTNACGRCHDGGLVVATALALPKVSLSAFAIGRIAQKVRTAGPPPSGTEDAVDSTGGPMPFFEEKDLPTQDLKDIIAYLKGA